MKRFLRLASRPSLSILSASSGLLCPEAPGRARVGSIRSRPASRLLGLFGVACLLLLDQSPQASPLEDAPSPAPADALVLPSATPASLPLYSIGQPTDEEQLYLEWINRARADPRAEAERWKTTDDPDVLGAYGFFSVDLDLMAAQIAAIPAAPPLSMHPALMAAARLHSADMLQNQFQRHESSDGTEPPARLTAQGYRWTRLGENVYARAKSVPHGHAGFEVDWGNEPGGMQIPPGHRNTIHNPNFREVGIGVVNGVNGDWGPQSVTQDFATRAGITPFVTGVVYYDLNQNQFYDLGEGIGGVEIQASGSSFRAVSARSGGYSVPVPGNGAFTVTFTAPGLAEPPRTVTIAQSENAKTDLVLEYVPPAITGPAQAPANQETAYSFTPVPAATEYEWKRSKLNPAIPAEGAENGLASFTFTPPAGYPVLNSSTKASGNFSFHLAHVAEENQFLELRRQLNPNPDGVLRFKSRLGWASDNQTAKVQVSSDSGGTWRDLWSQRGSNGRGETAFSDQSVSLGAFAGREIRLRWAFFVQVPYFNTADPGVGFYVDDITFENVEELLDNTVSSAGVATQFSFRPPELASYGLSVRPKFGDRQFPWGTIKKVAGVSGGHAAPVVRLTRLQLGPTGESTLFFELTAGAAARFLVQTALAATGPWTTAAAASVSAEPAPNKFKAGVRLDAAPVRFFRIASE